MRLSQMILPTVREAPSDATLASHALMLRAGLVRQTAVGIYAWLPIGLKVLQKLETIIREEHERVGAQEVLMPTMQSADIWQQSERYDAYGPEMLKLRDRHGREFVYGPTAEELATVLAKEFLTSYRDLPKTVYQFQWKFRDEIRPRHGVMRGREFLMKDAYSFDLDEAGGARTYQRMFDTYTAIFDRMGPKAKAVEADSGPIGGTSHEFLIGDTEVGHIFSFGTKYSAKLGLRIDTPTGVINPVMGSYGIGVSRLVAAIIEASHDERGIIWPDEVSPFKTLIVNALPTNEHARAVCEDLYRILPDCLYDDRACRAGEKFATAELIGIPEVIIVGKGVASGTYEVKQRGTGEVRHERIIDALYAD